MYYPNPERENRWNPKNLTLIRSCFFVFYGATILFVEAPRACVTKASIFTERINAKTLISRRFSGGLGFSTVFRSRFYDQNASRLRPYRAPRACDPKPSIFADQNAPQKNTAKINFFTFFKSCKKSTLTSIFAISKKLALWFFMIFWNSSKTLNSYFFRYSELDLDAF